MKKNLKLEKINHLNWCLEHLKFKEYKIDEMIYNKLYEDILNIVFSMENLDDISACKYYHKEINNKKIKERLKVYNINLSI